MDSGREGLAELGIVVQELAIPEEMCTASAFSCLETSPYCKPPWEGLFL
jgi:hypothetical protein